MLSFGWVFLGGFFLGRDTVYQYRKWEYLDEKQND